jgi:hypothetical protein
MSWQDTLNTTVPGYTNVVCADLFVTPSPDIAGIGVELLCPGLIRQVRLAVYAQVFIALACYTVSSTEEFTSAVKAASATTWIALAINSLIFLFGEPSGGPNSIGLGRLRVLLALSTISYGPGFLNLYRSVEKDRFAPLTIKAAERKIAEDPRLKANDHINSIFLSPLVLLAFLGFAAEAILFGVCVSRLSSQRVVTAAHFCGFSEVAMSGAEAFGWCLLCLLIPWLMPCFPFLMIAVWKSDPVTSWRLHVRKKSITASVGKVIFWGLSATLCALTEKSLSDDPASLLPGNQELQWTFGQILSVIMLVTIILSIANHLSKLPSYPIPDFQPSNSRFTLYIQLLCNCKQRVDMKAHCRSRCMGESPQVQTTIGDRFSA